MTDYPKEDTPKTSKEHPDIKGHPDDSYPNGVRTMQIGDYMMPQMGKPSDWKDTKSK